MSSESAELISPPPAGPVTESQRIDAMDVVRGFALVGIFFVNIQSFGQPFGHFIQPVPPAESSIFEKVAFYFTKTLCEGKFYPLFSMLFGMGLMLQYQKARNADRTFAKLGLRRLLILMMFGACHALLLWYGDILFIYAGVGMILLIFLRARARTLIVMSLVVWSLVIVANGFVIAFIEGAPEGGVISTTSAEHFDDPFGRLMQAMKNEKELENGPMSSIWVATETQAYREGPYGQLFKFRAMSWAMILVFCAMGFGWSVVAMIFLGAGLMKAGLFEHEMRHWFKRFAVLGLFVGLPLCVIAAWLPAWVHGMRGMVAAGVIATLGGPLLSLGYLGGWSMLVNSGRCQALTRALANAGRMALTNYLTQSVVATTIFYFYGFGMFGKTTHVQRIGIVLAVYLMQLVFSSIWLRYFQFGPMEWLWRTLTYGKMQPMMR